MRELTPQEINDAPDWATHYMIYEDGELYYYDLSDEVCANDERLTIDGFELAKIPRKEFDISEYGFSDGDMDIIIEADGGVFVSVDSDMIKPALGTIVFFVLTL